MFTPTAEFRAETIVAIAQRWTLGYAHLGLRARFRWDGRQVHVALSHPAHGAARTAFLVVAGSPPAGLEAAVAARMGLMLGGMLGRPAGGADECVNRKDTEF